jgi:hypothetical protein
MTAQARFATALIALTLFGCKSSVPTSAASAGSVESAIGSEASASSTQVQYITDPTMNDMKSVAVTIPANWRFQGVLMQGANCAPTPAGVFRATSPDGFSMAEQMPSLAWVWGTGPMISYTPKDGCLPFSGPMSPQDFLKYLAGTMKLHYDSDAPVPAAESAKAQKGLSDAQAVYAPKYAAIHAQPPKQTRDLARAAVSFQFGSTPMKGLLDVMVDCTETASAGMPMLSKWAPGHPSQIVNGQSSTVDKCIASVRYYASPATQFEALVRQWDAPGMGEKAEDAWMQAWIQRNNEQSQRAINNMNQQAAVQREASAQQFAHTMAVQQQMHDQFMQTFQEGHDHFMAQQQANMNARETSTSDWVDFALDRQTVMNTSSGQIYKITNQATVGGALQQVHGNGTPF